MGHNDPFQLFSDSYSHYQGVTGVISGGHSVQNRQKSYFLLCYLKRSPPIDVLTISNDSRHKIVITENVFNSFQSHAATTKGSTNELKCISGEFGIAKKMGKTGIPDAVRATNRILSICFCYCPGNILDQSRHCIGLT